MKNEAINVLKNCLKVIKYGNVLLVFDDYGKEIADAFTEASLEIQNFNLNTLFIPVIKQKKLSENDNELHNNLRNIINQADSIIFAVTSTDECTKFRIKVIDLAKNNFLKILHMPGVDKNIFLKAVKDINFKEIHNKGLSILKELYNTSKITIITESKKKEYVLKLNTSYRNPHICGGIAEKSEIMNLPTGEVYIAPNERESNGQIVINGSTDNTVVRRDDIILSFKNGKLLLNDSILPNESGIITLKKDIIAASKKNELNQHLCEFGIGINESVKFLTGDEIWDEKMFGTCHIALGANEPFGGIIKGNFHRDLIFYPKKVFLDNNLLKINWKKPAKDNNE